MITTGLTGSLIANFEWRAIEAGYDKGDPVGYGAINDLHKQLESTP
jgi:hypothetical protein